MSDSENTCTSCKIVRRFIPAKDLEYPNSDFTIQHSSLCQQAPALKAENERQRGFIQTMLDALQFSYAESSRFHTGRWRDINESVRAAIELAKTLQPARDVDAIPEKGE